jgi:hypothetical protein
MPNNTIANQSRLSLRFRFSGPRYQIRACASISCPCRHWIGNIIGTRTSIGDDTSSGFQNGCWICCADCLGFASIPRAASTSLSGLDNVKELGRC